LQSRSPSRTSNPQPQPPLLYHRESRQIYQVPAAPSPQSSKKGTASTTSAPVFVDKERIRAWAKGRYLSPSIGSSGNPYWQQQQQRSPSNPQAYPIVSQDDALEQAELMDELALTPEQLKGKRLMQERTKAKAAK
jgi:hypothetical protein